MSFNLASKSKQRFARAGQSGSAFIVEALILLVFLAASVAVFTQLFAHAATQATESVQLSRAVAMASDTAERFAADPDGVQAVTADDGLIVACTTTQTPTERGVMHHATIRVYKATDDAKGGDLPDGEPIYEIQTACYESGGA